MEYANNVLIVHIEKDKMIFFIILKGHVFAITEDHEDAVIKQFFATHSFSVIDSYGKELEIHTFAEFKEFAVAAKEAQKQFRLKIEKYHNCMARLFELRREKEKALCCNISDLFDKMVDLCDDATKELTDCLAAYHDSEEYDIIEKYIHEYSNDVKMCIIFGLYLTCLRAYICGFTTRSLSLDERIKLGFMKEFNYFLSKNEGIVDMYAKYFSLKKIEIEIIKETLREEGLDGGDWSTEPAEIDIM
jgi:hypothetical protein